MTDNVRLIALNSLSKTAQSTSTSQTPPKNKSPYKSGMSYEQRQAARERLGAMNRMRIGQDKATKLPGSDTAREAASLTKNFINGFAEDLGTKGNFTHNIASGGKTFGNAFMSAAASAPGLLARLATFVPAYATGLVTGKGFKGSLAYAADAGQNASDFIDNHVGLGSFDLAHAKRRIKTWQHRNMTDYMKRNDINPDNMSRLDSVAMFGQGMSDFAGNGIGMAGAGKVLGLAGKATAYTGNALSGMRGLGGLRYLDAARHLDKINSLTNYNMTVGPNAGALANTIAYGGNLITAHGLISGSSGASDMFADNVSIARNNYMPRFEGSSGYNPYLYSDDDLEAYGNIS